MIDERYLQTLIEKLKFALSEIDHNILANFPIEPIVSNIIAQDKQENYTYINSDLKITLDRILYQYDQKIVSKYLKLVISLLIKEYLRNSSRDSRFPGCIKSEYQEWFKRIIDDFDIQSDSYYTYSNDAFLKDIGVCSQQMIPVGGAWVAEISGIERRYLLTNGVINFLKAVYFHSLKLKGFSPLYQIHTVNCYVHKFNEAERANCYLRLSELLELNRDIKGIFAGSWLYDPELEKVSPRLAYLRKIPEQNGAQVFRIGARDADIKNALSKSTTRRKLYREGRYVPTGYYVIWTRKDLILWANRNRKL